MASSKLTALTVAVPLSTDILYFVSDPVGTPISKKALMSNLVLVSGLGTGVATLLAGTPSGTGGLAGTTSPTFVTQVFNPLGSSSAPGISFAGHPLAGFYLDNANGFLTLMSETSTYKLCTWSYLYGTILAADNAFGFTANNSNSTTAFDAGINRQATGLLGIGKFGAEFGFGGGLKLTLLGLGVTPTYGIHGAWTTGLTANQTMLVQDATGTTGITGIFFNAGAAQSTNPILTVGGLMQTGNHSFGGITSSFPMLKRSTTILQTRLADDSDFSFIQAKLRTHTNLTSGLVAATVNALVNSSIILYDAAGTAITVYGTS